MEHLRIPRGLRAILKPPSPTTHRRKASTIQAHVQPRRTHLLHSRRSFPQAKASHLTRPARRHSSQKPQPPYPNPNPTPSLGSPPPQSFTARLRKLSREYGYTVIGVYAALTIADFPFCLLAVKLIGPERVARAEHVVVGGARDILSQYFPNLLPQQGETDVEAETAEVAGEAEEGGATIWTQLALAFVIHKSFIFIRVPLTAAITPKVVKTLRSWGWNIGKRKPRVQ